MGGRCRLDQLGEERPCVELCSVHSETDASTLNKGDLEDETMGGVWTGMGMGTEMGTATGIGI
jgi:hypothetical protein